jgi:hypothetical protein
MTGRLSGQSHMDKIAISINDGLIQIKSPSVYLHFSHLEDDFIVLDGSDINLIISDSFVISLSSVDCILASKLRSVLSIVADRLISLVESSIIPTTPPEIAPPQIPTIYKRTDFPRIFEISVENCIFTFTKSFKDPDVVQVSLDSGFVQCELVGEGSDTKEFAVRINHGGAHISQAASKYAREKDVFEGREVLLLFKKLDSKTLILSVPKMDSSFSFYLTGKAIFILND